MPNKLKFLITTKLTLMGISQTSCDPAYGKVRTMDNSFHVHKNITVHYYYGRHFLLGIFIKQNWDI